MTRLFLILCIVLCSLLSVLVQAVSEVVAFERQRPRLVVDIWETNVLCDANGVETLRQVILWRWRWYDGTWDYYCWDWRLADKCQRPEHINGKWVGLFDGTLVEAVLYLETESTVDHEVMDRKRLPEGKRREY